MSSILTKNECQKLDSMSFLGALCEAVRKSSSSAGQMTLIFTVESHILYAGHTEVRQFSEFSGQYLTVSSITGKSRT